MKAPWTLIETVPGERMVWSMVDALRSMTGSRRSLQFSPAPAASETGAPKAIAGLTTMHDLLTRRVRGEDETV